MRIVFVLILILSMAELSWASCDLIISKYPKVTEYIESADILLLGEDHGSVLSLVGDVPVLPLVSCLRQQVRLVFEHILAEDLQFTKKANSKTEDMARLVDGYDRLRRNNQAEYIEILQYFQKRDGFKIEGGDISLKQINHTFSACHGHIKKHKLDLSIELLGKESQSLVIANESLAYEMQTCDGNYYRDLAMYSALVRSRKKGELTILYSGAYHMYPVTKAFQVLSPNLDVKRVSLGRKQNSYPVGVVREPSIGDELVLGEPHDKIAWEKVYDNIPLMGFVQMGYFLKEERPK